MGEAGLLRERASRTRSTRSIEALRPETLEDEQHGHDASVRSRTGSSAAITPWNFPLLMVFQSVIPALVAGNTVLLKPSEETPLVAQGVGRRS